MKLHLIFEYLPFTILAAVFVVTPFAPAQADEDIPAYKVLTCEKNCPNIAKPVLLDTPSTAFPARYTGRVRVYAEAMVDIRYMIGANGSIADAKIEQLLGPQEFEDRALATIEARRFTPAMEDGKPIAVNKRVRFWFRIEDGEKGARGTVVRDYRNAILLADCGKTDEAIAALKPVAAEAELNFFERTMIAYALAALYVKSGNYEDALDQIRIATIWEGQFLDSHSREQALRLRVELEAQEGQWAEAFAWFEILKKHASVTVDDPSAKLIAKLHALIDAPDLIVLAAKVPGTDDRIWQHTLLRRTFTFAGIQGKLDSFDLRCDAHGIESAVSDKAQWTVPKSWTGCMIYVTGQPGTSFRFAEVHAPNT